MLNYILYGKNNDQGNDPELVTVLESVVRDRLAETKKIGLSQDWFKTEFQYFCPP